MSTEVAQWESALDLESKGPLGCWFEPTVHHYFSSSNVRLLA